MRYALKYGAATLADTETSDGNTIPVTVLDYIDAMLAEDDIRITNLALASAYDAALNLLRTRWDEDRDGRMARQQADDAEAFRLGIEQITRSAIDMSSIKRAEDALHQQIATDSARAIDEYACNYIERILISDPDDNIRRVTTELVSEKHQLSKIHTKFSHVETERERLPVLVPRAIADLKYATVELRLHRQRKALLDAQQQNDSDAIIDVMRQMQELNAIKMELARFLGERILSPKK